MHTDYKAYFGYEEGIAPHVSQHSHPGRDLPQGGASGPDRRTSGTGHREPDAAEREYQFGQGYDHRKCQGHRGDRLGYPREGVAGRPGHRQPRRSAPRNVRPPRGPSRSSTCRAKPRTCTSSAPTYPKRSRPSGMGTASMQKPWPWSLRRVRTDHYPRASQTVTHLPSAFEQGYTS